MSSLKSERLDLNSLEGFQSDLPPWPLRRKIFDLSASDPRPAGIPINQTSTESVIHEDVVNEQAERYAKASQNLAASRRIGLMINVLSTQSKALPTHMELRA